MRCPWVGHGCCVHCYLQQGCAYDISVHVQNHIRQTNKCALRRWQRRWLGLSVHFNQPLLYPVGSAFSFSYHVQEILSYFRVGRWILFWVSRRPCAFFWLGCMIWLWLLCDHVLENQTFQLFLFAQKLFKNKKERFG